MSASDNLGRQWKGIRTTVGTIHAFTPTEGVYIDAIWHDGKKKWKVNGGLADGTMHPTVRDAKQHIESLHRRSK
jgi:hypothetical protein